MTPTPYEIITINGLKTVFYPIKGFPAIKANLLIRAGSSYEVGESWGVFHLIEHLAFEQTKSFSNWLDLELFKEEHGLRNNAYTGNDTVGFWTYGPNGSLNAALTLLNEIAFNSLLPESALAKQLSIISQEYSGKWDNPRTRFGRAVTQQIYGQDHPYVRDGMGQPEFVKTLSHRQLHDLYQKYFKNENAILSLTGDFEIEEAKSIISDLFISTGGKTYDFIKQNTRAGDRELYHFEDVQQDRISLIWPGPGFREIDFHQRIALKIGAYILGGSVRSLLNKRLREELHLAYSTGFNKSSAPFAGMFECWTATTPDKRELAIQEAKKVIYEFLSRPIDRTTFLRSKNYLKSSISLAFDSIHSVSDSITDDLFDDGVIRLPSDVIAEIKSITESQVRHTLARYLTPDNEFLAIMTKKKDSSSKS